MPTYKNVSNSRVVLEGKTINPGETVHTSCYYDENVVELLKVDDKPFFNPILLSTVVTKSAEISIPKKDNLGKPANKYAIHLCVEEGTVSIRYNHKDNNPPLLLYKGAKWNVRYFERNVEKIIVESPERFSLYIIVERLQ